MEEGIPPQLKELIESLESPSPLESFTEGLPSVSIIVHDGRGERTVTVNGLAPFHTIEDLQRALWLQENKSALLFPKYTFLGVKEDDGEFVSATGFFQQPTDSSEIRLPDPTDVFRTRQIQPEFVEADGEKKPLGYFPRGRVTLEEGLLRRYSGELPELHCFSFRYLLGLFRSAVSGVQAPISQLNWYGIFYPYFPSLENPQTTGDMTPNDLIQAQRIETYIQAKLKQVEVLNTLLEQSAEFKELRTTNVKYLTFQWAKPKSDEIDGVDTVFFQADVNDNRPYMRLLTPTTTPITKLYQPNELVLPKVSDSALLGTWVKELPPISNESFIFSKVEVRKEEYGIPALYGTLRVGEDGTADFTVQPSRNMRSLDMNKDLLRLGNAIVHAVEGMPFLRLDEVKLGRANMTLEIQLSGTKSKDFVKKITERIATINTVFQSILPPSDEKPKPILALRYKGVSNFVTEDRITAYLSFKFSGKMPQDVRKFTTDLSNEFGITEDEALVYITKYIQEKTEYSMIDGDSKEFLAVSNPGIDIAIHTSSVNTYSIQLYNARAITTEDIRRVTSALSCVFYLKDEDWEYALNGEVDESAEAANAVAEAANAVEEEELEEETSARGRGIGSSEGSAIMALNEDEEEEEEEDAGVAAVAAAPRPLPLAPAPVAKPAAAENKTTEKIVAHEWFINQLKKMDKMLFGFEAPKGSKITPYTKQCAANEHRHPSVFNQTQYEDMRAIYAPDEARGRVGFIVYGVPGTRDTPEAARGKVQQFTVLRYGSDPTNLLYFMCAPIFCLRDRLPILEGDWNSNKDREGNDKPKPSCPFCHGTRITDEKNPGEGQTVFVRKNKPKATRPQIYIKFLKEPKHPNGYDLPCCFISDKSPISSSDPRFSRIYAAMKKEPSATQKAEEEEEEDESERYAEVQSALQQRVQQIVNYELLSLKFSTQYVLGTEKYPLEPGKIGIPCIALDKYFGQDSTQQVARTAIKQEFKPNAHGFYRIGVFNKITSKATSLFAALAPALNVNTPAEVAQLFKNAITPRVFSALNFGNLVNEFFKPTEKVVSNSEIATWAGDNLGTFRPGTEPELKRLKRSYERFIEYIKDTTTPKQLRHFVHALAEPNLIFPAKGRDIGLNIIALEYTDDPRNSSTDIKVKCPIMGLDANRYANNAIAFLTTNGDGIWEPTVYVDTLSDKTATYHHKEAYYQITQHQLTQKNFPPVVRERYMEFITQCRSAYRGAYTLQRSVDTRYLLPVSRVFDIIRPLEPTGFVRDTYNHLVAITVSANPDKKSTSRQVIIPVSDDGNIFKNRDLTIYLGIQSIPLATANAVQQFYSSPQGMRLAEQSDVYVIDTFLKGERRLFGFRLGAPEANVKITLPVWSGSATGDSDISPDKIAVVGKKSWIFEYIINRRIMMSTKEDETLKETAFLMKKQQVDDIYQQLRLSFSNWIATTKNGGEMREYVEDLLERRDLPNFEKMRRLEIEFSAEIEKMFYPDDEPYEVGTVLLRKDCIAIENDPSKCGTTCKWVEDGTPKCKIHTPRLLNYTQENDEDEKEDSSNDESALSKDESGQSAVKYFTLRLFDELLRIPARRYELINRKIKRVQVPMTNIHIGSQWIIPENVPAWYDLLLAGTETSYKEEPQYWEEFSREEESKEEQEELYAAIHMRPLPEKLAAFFKPGMGRRLGLHLVGTTDEPNRGQALLEYYGVKDENKASNKVDESNITMLASLLKKPVLQIMVGQDPIFAQGASSVVTGTQLFSVHVLVPDYEEGPAVLKVLIDDSDAIPSDFFPDTVLQQKIKFGIRRMRRKGAATPAPAPAAVNLAENSSSGSNESEEEDSPAPAPTAKKTVARRVVFPSAAVVPAAAAPEPEPAPTAKKTIARRVVFPSAVKAAPAPAPAPAAAAAQSENEGPPPLEANNNSNSIGMEGVD